MPPIPPLQADTPEQTDDAADAAFLVSLGQRVRHIRALRGMSRKVLSRTSGISERYLAQLESGQGNVSVILLRKIARATFTPLEDLLGEANHSNDFSMIRELLRQAPAHAVVQATAILRGEAAGAVQKSRDRVALIGLRGAGKSTIGRAAAAALGWPFVELNKEIERHSGFSITEIFSIYGQEGYRRFEQQALRSVIARPGAMMLATGGGIVAESVTFDLLLRAFHTIWLKTSPVEHMDRVRRQGDLRPMANDSAAMAELVAMLESRAPLYARADDAVDTSGRDPQAVTGAVIAAINASAPAETGFRDRG